jgi:hypothetical protein
LYLRGWVNPSSTKPGYEKSKQQSATLIAEAADDGDFVFPKDDKVNPLVLPKNVRFSRVTTQDGAEEITVTLIDKPAVRLPEAYWFSFFPKDVEKIVLEKMGEPVDAADVVRGGNLQMHAIDQYIDVITKTGTLRITSPDVPLVAIGTRDAFDYPPDAPNLNSGIHFSLFNNLWGTNYAAWMEGTWTFRFRVEKR